MQNLLMIRMSPIEVLYLFVPLGNFDTLPRGERLETPGPDKRVLGYFRIYNLLVFGAKGVCKNILY